MQTTFDAEQVEYLVRTYSNLIARISYTWFSNTADVQDISQTVFLKLLTSRTTFETADIERAWIIRMTLNACKDLKKSFWRRSAALRMPRKSRLPCLNWRITRCWRQYRRSRSNTGMPFTCTITRVIRCRRLPN